MATPLRKMLLAAGALVLAVGAVYVVHTEGILYASAGQRSASVAAATPANATTVHSITVPVSDQASSRDFYVKQLGFTVVKDVPGAAERWIELVPPWGVDSATIVLSATTDMKPGSYRGLFWEVNDCASAVAAIRARGVAAQDCVDSPPGPLADFADPDGNVWTLSECDGSGTSAVPTPSASSPPVSPSVSAFEALDYADGTLANVGIPVSDQDRAMAFYVDALGFTVLKDRPNPAPFPGRYIELAAPGGGAHITLSVWWESMPAGSLRGLRLGTGDITGTIAALRGKGVAVDGGTGSFTDPDGNAWSVTKTTS